MANQQYTLQLVVTNFLDISSTASVIFSKVAAGEAPVVSIVGGPTQSFKISQGVRLSTLLSADSVCAGKKVRCVCFCMPLQATAVRVSLGFNVPGANSQGSEWERAAVSAYWGWSVRWGLY